MRRRAGISMMEIVVIVGIIAAVAALLLPVIGRARTAAAQVNCASNLREIGLGLRAYTVEFGRLPVRPGGLDQVSPHVLHYKDQPPDVSKVMERYCHRRDIFYCPSNAQGRDASTWWPYTSGTIAVTYQFPFWLKASMWSIPRPDYGQLVPERLLACDVLASDTAPSSPILWNHARASDGTPIGMNELYGDGHVQWIDHSNGWVPWGQSGGPLNWYYAGY